VRVPLRNTGNGSFLFTQKNLKRKRYDKETQNEYRFRKHWGASIYTAVRKDYT